MDKYQQNLHKMPTPTPTNSLYRNSSGAPKMANSRLLSFPGGQLSACLSLDLEGPFRRPMTNIQILVCIQICEATLFKCCESCLACIPHVWTADWQRNFSHAPSGEASPSFKLLCCIVFNSPPPSFPFPASTWQFFFSLASPFFWEMSWLHFLVESGLGVPTWIESMVLVSVSSFLAELNIAGGFVATLFTFILAAWRSKSPSSLTTTLDTTVGNRKSL